MHALVCECVCEFKLQYFKNECGHHLLQLRCYCLASKNNPPAPAFLSRLPCDPGLVSSWLPGPANSMPLARGPGLKTWLLQHSSSSLAFNTLAHLPFWSLPDRASELPPTRGGAFLSHPEERERTTRQLWSKLFTLLARIVDFQMSSRQWNIC